MGYSLPAGIVAALESPERLSVVVTGDGEFMMNEAELSISIRYQAPGLIILMDNQQFGTMRQHQEVNYPDRVSDTQLHNPDFAALANAFGAHRIRIDNGLNPRRWSGDTRNWNVTGAVLLNPGKLQEIERNKQRALLKCSYLDN